LRGLPSCLAWCLRRSQAGGVATRTGLHLRQESCHQGGRKKLPLLLREAPTVTYSPVIRCDASGYVLPTRPLAASHMAGAASGSWKQAPAMPARRQLLQPSSPEFLITAIIVLLMSYLLNRACALL
jgi:hypothetical protein